MPYTGIFIRDIVGQRPDQPTNAWSECPDLIPYGSTLATDLSIFTSTAGYSNPFSSNVYTNQSNYVYLRGINTNSGAQKSRIYYYYTTADLALWPANWRSDKVTVNGLEQNWIDVSATASQQVVVGQTGLLWTPPFIDDHSGHHYCMIGWVDNSANPQPPDLKALAKMGSTDDLIAFIHAHPNMGWRNTVDYNSPPPNDTYTIPFTVPADGAQVLLTVSFSHIPGDGTFNLSMQGDPNGSPTYVIPTSPISNFAGGINQDMTYSSNFVSSVTLQYWKGATPPPQIAKIKVAVNTIVSRPMCSLLNALYLPMGLEIPVRYFPEFDGGVNAYTTLGSQTWNIKFG